ncbi:DUF4395 domain-containing protein [Thiomicrorhabdus sp. ZW0627]|uniref:DUF4395 domain-containing protein n=1 Tax=Thiomicrorhabdus sp. ZW0627 TaxID=3039774 RepID=UPI00243730BE|nr:DUF4395 domain-containing protein [Thiomicrorhabdus sp. ZW0627]MDG6773921.1 DUF4395 domain-containing protein [Thiomicrorhabdus sp. ZW0627]
MLDVIKNLWFRDPKEETVYINDVAVRIRAGILLAIPIFMSFTLYDAIFVSNWIVDGNTAVDSGDMDWDYHIIYHVDAIRRTFDYSFQTWVLLYGLFELLSGLFVTTSRLSPIILISSFLARNQKPVWKPLVPKRFAWVLGSTFIAVCLVFFNPEIFANWVNTVAGSQVLPTTENYMSPYIPLVLVWICLGFMWLEAVLGFCVGCKIHSLLVWMGILKEECEACNNIDWEEIARKNKERLAQKEAEEKTS